MTDPRTGSLKRITLLGGFGFLGSRICQKLVSVGHDVRVFDLPNASTAGVSSIVNRIESVRGDHGNVKEVMDALKGADTVIHLIHTTVPGSSMLDPAFDIQSNVAASAAWLSRLGETSVKQVIYISSGGTVYGRPAELPIHEAHALEPISSYGISKLACEKFVSMYCDLAGITHHILRPSNAYGENQPSDRGQGILGVYIDHLARGRPLEVWGTGTAVRDYVHVDDIAAAAVALLSYRGAERVFNISTGVGHSITDILRIIRDTTGKDPETVSMVDRGFDVPDNVLDNSRLCAETGWAPTVTLPQGITRMLAAAGITRRAGS